MSHSATIEAPSCPVCQKAGDAYSVPAGDFQVYKCPACGLEYTWPIPSEVELQAFYATYHDIRARQDVVIRNAERNLALLRDHGLTGDSTILDFGCGQGDFVRVAGPNCYGLELSGNDGERVYATAEDLPVNKFDFITLWGVLEHLNHPLEIMASVAGLLKSGGKIVLTTVDAEGVIPYYYKPIEHLTYWTGAAFDQLFARIGMTVVAKVPYMMVQASEVYMDRLLSRTPEVYRPAILPSIEDMPDFIEVPTNEILVVAGQS